MFNIKGYLQLEHYKKPNTQMIIVPYHQLEIDTQYFIDRLDLDLNMLDINHEYKYKGVVSNKNHGDISIKNGYMKVLSSNNWIYKDKFLILEDIYPIGKRIVFYENTKWKIENDLERVIIKAVEKILSGKINPDIGRPYIDEYFPIRSQYCVDSNFKWNI